MKKGWNTNCLIYLVFVLVLNCKNETHPLRLENINGWLTRRLKYKLKSPSGFFSGAPLGSHLQLAGWEGCFPLPVSSTEIYI